MGKLDRQEAMLIKTTASDIAVRGREIGSKLRLQDSRGNEEDQLLR